MPVAIPRGLPPIFIQGIAKDNPIMYGIGIKQSGLGNSNTMLHSGTTTKCPIPFHNSN